MSEWSSPVKEVNQRSSDRSDREGSQGPSNAPAGSDRPTTGFRGAFHQRIADPMKAQAAVALSLIVGVLLVSTLGVGTYVWTLTDDIPSTERLEAPVSHLATIAYTADGKELARYARQNRTSVPYDSISTHVSNALIATEDERFYKHWGVDSKAILAAIADILTGGFRGASTITQQLARNLYVDEVGSAVTIKRKLVEMITAVELERQYTKREIIEMYLNTVNFGGNVYGIEAAAHTYFGRRASELTPLQAATLVGLLKATSRYNPVRNPKSAKQRRNLVLQLMVSRDFLASAYYQQHKNDPVQVDYHSSRLSSSLAPYFAEHVRTVLRDWTSDPEHSLHGYDIYGDGLRVYTTLDAELQAVAQSAVEDQLSLLQKVVGYQRSKPSARLHSTRLEDYQSLKPGVDYDPFAHFWTSQPEVSDDFIRGTAQFDTLSARGITDIWALNRLRSTESFVDSLRSAKAQLSAGLVSLDPRNGHVQVWIGGRDFRIDKYDKVAQSRRQPGSTFKPFTYTAAIDNGYSPDHTLLDSPFTWKDAGADTTWTPQNYNRQSSGEMFTLSQALAHSKNTITARLALDMNPSTVAAYARRMGIRSPLRAVPSIALGTSEVTLLEMAAAYSTLASGGLYNEPVTITRVEDGSGNVLWETSPTPSEALSPQTAYTVVDMMRGVIDEGTGARIRTQFDLGAYDLAGKTGTTSRAADTWFMLMHPELLSGAWIGFNDPQLTFRTNFWGQGAHSALLVVGDYYRRIADSEEVRLSTEASFPLPQGDPAPATETDPGGQIAW